MNLLCCIIINMTSRFYRHPCIDPNTGKWICDNKNTTAKNMPISTYNPKTIVRRPDTIAPQRPMRKPNLKRPPAPTPPTSQTPALPSPQRTPQTPALPSPQPSPETPALPLPPQPSQSRTRLVPRALPFSPVQPPEPVVLSPPVRTLESVTTAGTVTYNPLLEGIKQFKPPPAFTPSFPGWNGRAISERQTEVVASRPPQTIDARPPANLPITGFQEGTQPTQQVVRPEYRIATIPPSMDSNNAEETPVIEVHRNIDLKKPREQRFHPYERIPRNVLALPQPANQSESGPSGVQQESPQSIVQTPIPDQEYRGEKRKEVPTRRYHPYFFRRPNSIMNEDSRTTEQDPVDSVPQLSQEEYRGIKRKGAPERTSHPFAAAPGRPGDDWTTPVTQTEDDDEPEARGSKRKTVPERTSHPYAAAPGRPGDDWTEETILPSGVFHPGQHEPEARGLKRKTVPVRTRHPYAAAPGRPGNDWTNPESEPVQEPETVQAESEPSSSTVYEQTTVAGSNETETAVADSENVDDTATTLGTVASSNDKKRKFDEFERTTHPFQELPRGPSLVVLTPDNNIIPYNANQQGVPPPPYATLPTAADAQRSDTLNELAFQTRNQRQRNNISFTQMGQEIFTQIGQDIYSALVNEPEQPEQPQTEEETLALPAPEEPAPEEPEETATLPTLQEVAGGPYSERVRPPTMIPRQLRVPQGPAPQEPELAPQEQQAAATLPTLQQVVGGPYSENVQVPTMIPRQLRR